MAYVDAIDSHYQYVKGRIAAINPQRQVKGLLMAQDWPPKKVALEAFYILNLADSPIGRQGDSATIPIVYEHVQWVWIIAGNDVSTGQQANNRGDRFRTAFQMKDELTQALYPRFAEKFTWSLVNGTWTPTPLNPVEYIHWPPPEFREKLDKDSGLVYGSAMVTLTTMLDPILA